MAPFNRLDAVGWFSAGRSESSCCGMRFPLVVAAYTYLAFERRRDGPPRVECRAFDGLIMSALVGTVAISVGVSLLLVSILFGVRLWRAAIVGKPAARRRWPEVLGKSAPWWITEVGVAFGRGELTGGALVGER